MLSSVSLIYTQLCLFWMFSLSSLSQVLKSGSHFFFAKYGSGPWHPNISTTSWALADHHAEDTMEVFILEPSSEWIGTLGPPPPSHRKHLCLISHLWEYTEGKHSFPTASSFPLQAPGICNTWSPFKDWKQEENRKLAYLTHCGFYCVENQFCHKQWPKDGTRSDLHHLYRLLS